MKSFKQFILEYAGPSDIRKVKAFTGVGFRHHPDDNEKVHKDLLSKGFEEKESYKHGPATATRYIHPSTKRTVEHLKTSDHSTVNITR